MSKRGFTINTKTHLVVSISNQTVTVIKEKGEVDVFPVSTSKFGFGEGKDTKMTPRGWHVITEVIGENAEPGTVFVGRKPTGVVLKSGEEGKDKDYILTRIFRLMGIEEFNDTTYDRMVYFHGTNQEDLIGVPASDGCVRMKNKDIIELSTFVGRGTLVNIIE